MSDREVRLLQGRVAQLDAELRRRAVFNATPAPPTLPVIYQVTGGNVLPAGGTVGIVRVATTVLGSAMPNPGGGTGTVIVPAFPVPAGLPNGVGVAQDTGGVGAYIFALLDSRSPYTADMVETRQFTVTTSVYLDLVSGLITYRYVCWIIGVGT